ncbi:MAG TPA: type I methionyl aminopeptidase [Tepidiformaceae bacterium]|nr:type I methionyl aminopeptidase [Tepidiformaceae bacterium]
MAIKLKSEDELRVMREAGQIVGQTLAQLREMVRPGLNILEIERFVHDEFKRLGARETFRNYVPAPRYPPYPSNICVSINDELVHGIPRDRVLKEGDIVTMDLGATYRGYVGDAAITVAVGEVSPEAKRLMKATEDALWAGIKAARHARYLIDICGAIEDCITPTGFSIVRGYGGHGIGRDMHEEPHVPNHRFRGKGAPIRNGLVLAIEPMLNAGAPEVYEAEDHWTVKTKDGSLCCHFEHTIAIREGREPEILTLP